MPSPGPDEDPFIPGADPLAAGDDHRAPPPERSPDPEVRLQHARDVAWRALNRREHTVADLARTLARRRVEPAIIDAVVGELCEQGYLDDASFARRFADDRRRLDGWGAERIERRLAELGVDRELIVAAVGERDHEGELDAAVALLCRRFPDPPATPRDCERALGLLVRKGYELELAHDAIRRHAGAPAFELPRHGGAAAFERPAAPALRPASDSATSVDRSRGDDRIASGCRRYYDPEQRQVEPDGS